MVYKIEIFRYHDLVETYENDNVEEVLMWYKSNWQYCYEVGGCAFDLYKDGIELSFEEELKLGFH